MGSFTAKMDAITIYRLYLLLEYEARLVHGRNYILFILTTVVPTTQKLLYQHRAYSRESRLV